MRTYLNCPTLDSALWLLSGSGIYVYKLYMQLYFYCISIIVFVTLYTAMVYVCCSGAAGLAFCFLEVVWLFHV